MAQDGPMIVLDQNGLPGTVAQAEPFSPDGQSQVLIRFQNGQQVIAPREMLVGRDDGRYHLPVSIEKLMADQEGESREDEFLHRSDVQAVNGDQLLVIPVVAEEAKVQKGERQTGVVEIRKRVSEHTETVDQPLQSEELEIERVAVHRLVDEPLPIRHEGDTLVIPLFEEVLVVEKRLMLREEVHVKKLRKEVHNPQEVLLRAERVEIVRKAGSGENLRQNEATQ